MDDALIIGAGAVGTNIAILLSHFGVSVRLIDSEPDILQGAPRASLINHGDGFEYYKPGHRLTGFYCIDGAFAKGLLYPLHAFRTNVCDIERPIRFFVSRESVAAGRVAFEQFAGNAESMRTHFARQFQAVANSTGWSSEQLEMRLLRTPRTFARALEANEFVDVEGVVGGYAGSSFGINMPQYYAYLKALIRKQQIPFHASTTIAAVEPTATGYYVHTDAFTCHARHILIAAGHQIANLASKFKHAAPVAQRGAFFLNGMTFLRLPATPDATLRATLQRINFTLQQEHGAMYACMVAPNAEADGFGAIYYPSNHGSQLRRHEFDPVEPTAPPAEWEVLIKNGLPSDDPHVQRTFAQAAQIYPFLKDYATVSHTLCRSVFNVETAESEHGLDRRVREIVPLPQTERSGGSISAWSAPKWTNAELVALMATDYVLQALRSDALPKNINAGFGPTCLDVPAIAMKLDLRDVEMDLEDALTYARRQRAPERVVDATLRWFRRQAN